MSNEDQMQAGWAAPDATVAPSPTPPPTPPPPTGDQVPFAPPKPPSSPRPTADLWAVLLAVGAVVMLGLASFEGLLNNPDVFVPLVVLRLAIAGVISALPWAIMRPRRQNVFFVSFSILVLLLAVAVFRVN